MWNKRLSNWTITTTVIWRACGRNLISWWVQRLWSRKRLFSPGSGTDPAELKTVGKMGSIVHTPQNLLNIKIHLRRKWEFRTPIWGFIHINFHRFCWSQKILQDREFLAVLKDADIETANESGIYEVLDADMSLAEVDSSKRDFLGQKWYNFQNQSWTFTVHFSSLSCSGAPSLWWLFWFLGSARQHSQILEACGLH